MNIIQSYWSSPARTETGSVFDRPNGGWLGERQHAISWSLSCLKLKQSYPDLQLYTDNDGLDWLINKLILPYKEVYNSLEGVPQLNPSLWALAKLYVYALQDNPFLHVDGDVYIWEPFNESFLRSPLIAQNVEYDMKDNPSGNIYIGSALKFLREGLGLPKDVIKSINEFKHSGKMYGYNTGLVGGSNTAFFKVYTRAVFDFIKANPDLTYEGRDMSFFEQFFFHAISSAKKLEVSVLFNPELAVSPEAYANMMQFNLVPIKEKYIHVIGIGKRNKVPCRQVAMRLKYEFPRQYQHIMSVYPIVNFYLPTKMTSEETVPEAFPYTCMLLRKLNLAIPKRSFPSFVREVENLISKDLDNKNLQLLNDFFQIEHFRFKNRHEPQINDLQTTSILNLLYTSSRDIILDLKMTFNAGAGKIASMFFPCPSELTSEKLLDLYEKNQNKSPASKPHLVMLSQNAQQTNVEPLSSWGSLLLFFEDEVHSGSELIAYLAGQNLLNEWPESSLRDQVFSFITTFSVCYNYLILSD